MAEYSQRRPLVSFSRKLLRWVLQIFIGGILLLSALGKSLDMTGFIEVLKTYEAFSLFMLEPVAFFVTGIEFVLGIWIVSGYRLPLSAFAAGLLNTVYAGWAAVTLLRGLTLLNCGCFGIFYPQPLTWLTPVQDLVLVGICMVLVYLSLTEGNPHRGLRPAVLN